MEKKPLDEISPSIKIVQKLLNFDKKILWWKKLIFCKTKLFIINNLNFNTFLIPMHSQ